MLKDSQQVNVKESSNGHVPASTRIPEIVRELADVAELPFNELHEAIVGLTVAGDLTDDVIEQIDTVTDGGEPFDMLRLAAKIQRFYVARLVNLWGRLQRGDFETTWHVIVGK